MRRWQAVMAVMAAIAMIACSDSTGPVAVGGRWHLRSIDGDPLPALTFSATNYTEEVTAGSIELQPEVEAFYLNLTFRTNDAGTITVEEEVIPGEYSRLSDGDLVFDAGLETYTGYIESGNLYVTVDGRLLRFRK